MERMEKRGENKQTYKVEYWTQAGRDAVILFHIEVDIHFYTITLVLLLSTCKIIRNMYQHHEYFQLIL